MQIPTQLKSGIQKGFGLLLIYSTVDSWVESIFSVPQTALSGILKSLGSDSDISAKLKKDNTARRDLIKNYYENIINEFMGIIKENLEYEVESVKVGISRQKLEEMFQKNDFRELKEQLSGSRNKLETIRLFEKLLKNLRNSLFENREEIIALGKIELYKSGIYEEEQKKDKIQENLDQFFNKSQSIDPNSIIQDWLKERFDISHGKYPGPQEFNKMVFEFGQMIGGNLRISRKTSKVRVGVELIISVSLLAALYGVKILKSAISKPIEILKVMLVGFMHGLDLDSLKNQKSNLDPLLISLRNIPSEIENVFNNTYEEIARDFDYKNSYSGKKGPMKALEALVAEKWSYLVQDSVPNDIKEAALENPDIVQDVMAQGVNITRKDNLGYLLLAAIETIPTFLSQIAFTVGNNLGSNCNTFVSNIKRENNKVPVAAL